MHCASTMTLAIILFFGNFPVEASDVAIGQSSMSLSKEWESVKDQDWVASRKADGKTIGVLMVKKLSKTAKEEAEEMASITEKNKALKTVVKRGTLKTEGGAEVAYVYLSLNAADKKMGIENPMAFYSWYVPQEAGCVTIKLKCNMNDSSTLAEEVESALRQLSK